MTEQPKEITVDIRGRQVTVLKTGQGDPLLYLHGAFAHQEWPDFLDILSQSYSVYMPICPGFKDPSELDAIDDILDLTLYYLDLIEALSIESPVIIGHYFGAMIAAEMAAICSHNIRKLILIAPAGMWLEEAPGIDYNVVPLSETRQILFHDPESNVAPHLKYDVEAAVEKAALHIERVRALSVVGKFLWPIPDKGLSKRIGRIKVPILIVCGQSDKIVPPAHGKALVDLTTNGRLEIVPDSGHLIYMEKPGQILESVSKFIDE